MKNAFEYPATYSTFLFTPLSKGCIVEAEQSAYEVQLSQARESGINLHQAQADLV